MLAWNSKSNGKARSVKKLGMDFLAASARGVRMDDDSAELIEMLCTGIGSIMEDASVIALTIRGASAEERIDRIRESQRASALIASLTAAVHSLV